MLCSFYFKERRGRVNGVVASGSGVGLILFPLLMTYLLDQVGFVATFYILAGVALQGIICGALIVPPETALWIKNGTKTNIYKRALPKATGDGSTKIKLEIVVGDTTQSSAHQNYDSPSSEPYSISVRLSQIKQNYKTSELIHKLKDALKSLIDTNLLRDKSYILYSISSCLWFVSFVTPLVFIPDRAISFGISKDNGAMLISWLGIANMLGRIGFGFIIDLPIIRKHRLYLYCFSFIVCGVATLVNFGTELHHQIIYSIIYGTFLGEKTAKLVSHGPR